MIRCLPTVCRRRQAARKAHLGRTLAAGIEPVLAELAAGELVVDLRSGSYAGLGRLPHAVTVDCLTEHPDGRRTVITHFNKAHKGKLARILAGSRAEPNDAASVATVARRAGYMSSATAIR